MEGVDENLGRWPVSTEIPVQWGDMDSLNHVNHTVFLTWMETARMIYFDQCGIMEKMESEGIGPILASLKANYISPVHFPDKMTVKATISAMGNSSFEMSYRIFSEKNSGKIACEGTVLGVLFDYNSGKSTPIPDELRSRIFEIESNGSDDP